MIGGELHVRSGCKAGDKSRSAPEVSLDLSFQRSTFLVDLQFIDIWVLMLSCISNSDKIASFCVFIASISGTVSLLPLRPHLLQEGFRGTGVFVSFSSFPPNPPPPHTCQFLHAVAAQKSLKIRSVYTPEAQQPASK